MIAGGGASSLIALVLGKLTDMAFYQQDAVVVYLAPVALLGISVLHGGSQYLSQFLLVRVAQGVMLELRTLMFERILHWGDDLFMKYRCAEVQAKFINEASTALTNAAGVLTIIIRDSIQIVCLLGVLFWHNWLLTISDLHRWSSYCLNSQMGEPTYQALDNADSTNIWGADRHNSGKLQW